MSIEKKFETRPSLLKAKHLVVKLEYGLGLWLLKVGNMQLISSRNQYRGQYLSNPLGILLPSREHVGSGIDA